MKNQTVNQITLEYRRKGKQTQTLIFYVVLTVSVLKKKKKEAGSWWIDGICSHVSAQYRLKHFLFFFLFSKYIAHIFFVDWVFFILFHFFLHRFGSDSITTTITTSNAHKANKTRKQHITEKHNRIFCFFFILQKGYNQTLNTFKHTQPPFNKFP